MTLAMTAALVIGQRFGRDERGLEQPSRVEQMRKAARPRSHLAEQHNGGDPSFFSRAEGHCAYRLRQLG